MVSSANPAARAAIFDRLEKTADGLAVALAVSLPWSTSATGILAVLWLIALIPTLDLSSLRRILLTPAGGLPVLLWGLGVVGISWAVDVPMAERIEGLNSFHKLLAIPLLMAQFQRSDRAAWVMVGFLASCGVMLVVSWLLVLLPGLTWRGKGPVGVPVKDYISQSVAFTICGFLLAGFAVDAWRMGRRRVAVFSVLAAMMFLANILYVSFSRTVLVVIPLLLVLFAATRLARKSAVLLTSFAVVAAVLVWWTTPLVRTNVTDMFLEIVRLDPEGAETRAGERLVFWRKSVGFVAAAPAVGHGTGSIREQFRRAAEGQVGMAATRAANPHNQILAVAIQLGLLGAAVLIAMWSAHVQVFWGAGFVHWAGMVVAMQNVIGSLFNSHLFDFGHGWIYVVGVGVAAGAVLRAPAKPQ